MKACVARAVYAEIAMTVGTWSNGALAERLVPHATVDIDSVKERLRQLRSGNKAPTLESWSWLSEPYPQAELQRWIEHPLFLLLNPPARLVPVGDHGADVGDWAKIYRALDMIEGEIREYLWTPPARLEAGTGAELLEFTQKQYNELVNSQDFETLDWALKLTVMAALAKLGQWSGKPHLWRSAVLWTRGNFSRAVAVTPQLLVGWASLEKNFEDQVWRAYRPHTQPFDFFEESNMKSSVESAVGAAEWHRSRSGVFEPLPDGKNRHPPVPYVSHAFLKRHCGLALDRVRDAPNNQGSLP